MGHVFISYSHKDTKYAHGLADSLQNMGIDVWIDERLDYGSQWPLEIQKQLDSCDAFILIMSPRSFASDWVQSELQRAKRKMKPIFPLLLEGDEPWLSVESTQYYDVRNKDLPDNKFYSALRRVVSPGPNDRPQTEFSSPPRTKQPPKKISPGLSMGILLGVGGFGAVSILCLVIMLPLLSKMLSPAPTSIPSTAIVITATLAPSETSIAAPVTSMANTAEPTSSSVPTWTPSPIPSATWTLVPTRVPPTFTPAPPSPEGTWDVVANGYEGTLEISITNGNVRGSIFGDIIEGTWNEFSQEIDFKRYNTPDPNFYQLYTGSQIKQGGRYILVGSFDDHRTDGSVVTASWSATR